MKKLISFLLLLTSLPALAADILSHSITVNILPDTGHIHVLDNIEIPAHSDIKNIETFSLNEKLKLLNSSIPLTPARESAIQNSFGIRANSYALKTPAKKLIIEYSGTLNKPGSEENFAAITPNGVFLSKTNRWFAISGTELVEFSLIVNLPRDWVSMSQGARTSHTIANDMRSSAWQEKNPQDDIYIYANRLFEQNEERNGIAAIVLTAQEDPELAKSYIDATFNYINMYSDLIGDYPYKKFAVVEGFEGNGYGFPSFTMLGPRVIRFPFILYTSYPHEIVHNWWGNGVYVDEASGNWSEGLTAYLSDHLLKEQRGKGMDYRRDTLQKYSNFVQTEKEFPLSEFRFRHSQASSAIGYGKTLMLFHMLRVQLGDDIFKQGLKKFYSEYKFQTASYADIQNIYEQLSKKSLQDFFEQWTHRVGAPGLKIGTIAQDKNKVGYTIELTMEQTGDIYDLQIPISLWNKDDGLHHQEVVKIDKQQTLIRLTSAKEISKLQIDPQFDVFRRLEQSEIPAALSQGFGSAKIAVILPAQANTRYGEYKALAQNWQQTQSGQWDIIDSQNLKTLPAHEAVWILGADNKFKDTFRKMLPVTVQIDKDTVNIDDKSYSLQTHSFVGCRKNTQTICMISENSMESIGNLARKLPHYHKYGYLVFKGDDAQNVEKGSWVAENSPLIHKFAESKSPMAKPDPRPPLTQATF